MSTTPTEFKEIHFPASSASTPEFQRHKLHQSFQGLVHLRCGRTGPRSRDRASLAREEDELHEETRKEQDNDKGGQEERGRLTRF